MHACTHSHTHTHKYTFSTTYYWPNTTCPEHSVLLYIHGFDCYTYPSKFPQSLLPTVSSDLLLLYPE